MNAWQTRQSDARPLRIAYRMSSAVLRAPSFRIAFARWLFTVVTLTKSRAAISFGFCYSPYLATIPKHFGPLAYYEKLIDLYAHFTATPLLVRRLRSTTHPVVRLAHVYAHAHQAPAAATGAGADGGERHRVSRTTG